LYQLLAEKLRGRSTPVRVAIVGCGWLGSRMLRELARIDNLEPALVVTRTAGRAVAAFESIGVAPADLAVVSDAAGLSAAQASQKAIVCTDLRVLSDVRGIEVVFEATGDVLAGAEAVTHAIEGGMHVVTMSSELDATLGMSLTRRAREAGVVYSSADGDQPGVLARLLRELEFKGFRPRIAGNCKEHLDPYQTPEGVRRFVRLGQNPYKICSFTDGSKQSTELASLANAFGFSVLRRGALGPTTTKRHLVESFDELVDLSSLEGSYVDYTMGSTEPAQGGPVFVVAHRGEPEAREELDYLKQGAGPFYLFFRDHHLCHFEAASSVVEAALLGVATLRPVGRFVDVVAIAKRELQPGQKLDGIGGFDCYGVVETAETVAREGLLPIGMSGYAAVRKRVPKDEPLTHDVVELAENAAVALRREQDRLPLGQAIS
jgi:predicted homoserine dehydrogenase-like protein